MGDIVVEPLDATGGLFEGLRWRDGRWWLADILGQKVHSFAPGEPLRTEYAHDDGLSGLGWLPDGSLLVVATQSRKLLRLAPGATRAEVHADLAPFCGDLPGFTNDMAVTADGHAYVGFDPDYATYDLASELGLLLHIAPDGRAGIAASGLCFPNGMVITSDGALILAETGRPRLTRFAIGADGTLGAPEAWAELATGDQRTAAGDALTLDRIGLDGCAMDAEGCVWVANSRSGHCLRVAAGGAIRAALALRDGLSCLACALGGDDGRTLLLSGIDPAAPHGTPTARLFFARVPVAG